MARHIHVHMHGTSDSNWEESKHPRGHGGQFGSGGAGKKTPKTNAELAALAHEAYLAAVHAGNGVMAEHYLKQRERFKRLAEIDRKRMQAAKGNRSDR